MNENTNQLPNSDRQGITVEQVAKKPDELSGLNIEARIKIFDPDSGDVKVEGRA